MIPLAPRRATQRAGLAHLGMAGAVRSLGLTHEPWCGMAVTILCGCCMQLKSRLSNSRVVFRGIGGLCIAIFLAACAPQEMGGPQLAERHLNAAAQRRHQAEVRIARYLLSVQSAADVLRANPAHSEALEIYNRAVGELVVTLRQAKGGLWWNQDHIARDGDWSCWLEFARGNSAGRCDPAGFSNFETASEVPPRYGNRSTRPGLGAALVGVGPSHPAPAFSPRDGMRSAVTATIDFSGDTATLSLWDPSEAGRCRLNGRSFPLAADFTAPLDHRRPESQLWHGLMGAIKVSSYMSDTGLYMLQPYDPRKIPLVFVHGLISTPQVWSKTIRALETDPELRGKYQYWVFRYPTGNPPSYSALRLRQELTRVGKLYPRSKDYVLVGHSMGGIVSRMQAVTVTRESWDVIGHERAERFFAIVPDGSIGDRATRFESNPKIGRLVFICTPHRGSNLAIGTLGGLLRRLISLPADVSGPLIGSAGNAIAIVSGSPHRLPNSVTGLSPQSPLLRVVGSVPIQAPYHSIIGDRGRGDGVNGSDGVVDYRSATVAGAASELIVPGPHSSQDLPETHAELRRILRLHIAEITGAPR